MKKFATLTIGQAPRPDLAPVFNAIAPAGTEVVHAGCLDGLTKAEVDKQFAPVGSEGLLTSRMLDGTAVVLGKSAVRKALQEKIHQLEKAGCSPIVLLCTGEFEELTTEKVRLIEPDRLLPPVFAALLNPLQVGVMVPLIEQAQSELNKWKGLDKPPVLLLPLLTRLLKKNSKKPHESSLIKARRSSCSTAWVIPRRCAISVRKR